MPFPPKKPAAKKPPFPAKEGPTPEAPLEAEAPLDEEEGEDEAPLADAPKGKTATPGVKTADPKPAGGGKGTPAPVTPGQGVPDVKPHEESTKTEPEGDKEKLPAEADTAPAKEQPKGLPSLAVMTKTEAEAAAKDPMNNPHVQRLASAVHGLAKLVQQHHALLGAMPPPGQATSPLGQKPGGPVGQPGTKPGMQPGMKPGMQPGMKPGMPGGKPGMGMQPGMKPAAPLAAPATPALAIEQVREMMTIIEAANTGRLPRQAAAMLISTGFGLSPEVAMKMVVQDASPEQALGALTPGGAPAPGAPTAPGVPGAPGAAPAAINPEEEELEEGLEDPELEEGEEGADDFTPEDDEDEDGLDSKGQSRFARQFGPFKTDAADRLDFTSLNLTITGLEATRSSLDARLDALHYARTVLREDEWNEEDHPRDEGGKFGSGGGGGDKPSGGGGGEGGRSKLTSTERTFLKEFARAKSDKQVMEKMGLDRNQALKLANGIRDKVGLSSSDSLRKYAKNMKDEPDDRADEWNEEDHPRDESGRFGAGGGGSDKGTKNEKGGGSRAAAFASAERAYQARFGKEAIQKGYDLKASASGKASDPKDKSVPHTSLDPLWRSKNPEEKAEKKVRPANVFHAAAREADAAGDKAKAERLFKLADAVKGERNIVKERIREEVKQAAKFGAPKAHPSTPPQGKDEYYKTNAHPDNIARMKSLQVADVKFHGGGGINEKMKITMADGTKVAWKPAHGESYARSNVAVGTYYIREAAASDLARVIGVQDLVPAAVAYHGPSEGFRKTSGVLSEHGPFGAPKSDDKESVKEARSAGVVGSMHAWAPGTAINDMWKAPDLDRDAVERARVFDYVSGNSDRHGGNMVVHERDGKHYPVLIDNGLSFNSSGIPDRHIYPSATLKWDGLLDSTKKMIRDIDPREVAKALKKSGLDREASKLALARLHHIQAEPHYLEGGADRFTYSSKYDDRGVEAKRAVERYTGLAEKTISAHDGDR
jgi:DNA-binding CsgD family transcriptional regulator